MNDTPQPSAASSFPPTMWTQVMKMRDDSNPEENERILNRLCQTYWQPLFQYARRLGNSPELAQDLTQGFFLHLLTKGVFDMAEREKGKLRTLLLTAFNNFIRGEYDKATAFKRGGREGTLSLEALEDAESTYRIEADENATPETHYDKRCAHELLAAAAKSLEQRHSDTGKQAHYDSLKQFLTVSGNEQSYGVEAEKLGIRGDYYKILVQRFRIQFKEALTQQVKETLPEGASEADVQQEIMEIIRLAYA